MVTYLFSMSMDPCTRDFKMASISPASGPLHGRLNCPRDDNKPNHSDSRLPAMLPGKESDWLPYPTHGQKRIILQATYMNMYNYLQDHIACMGLQLSANC